MLGLTFAATSCISFKHKTFPEMSHYSSDEVQVVRVGRGAFFMAKKICGSKELSAMLKGIKGVETIECASAESVDECRQLLASRAGNLLLETIDDNDTTRIYAHPLSDGCFEQMMIVSQYSPSNMSVVVISGKLRMDGGLLDKSI